MKNRIRIARGTKADLQSVTENIPTGVPIYTTDENKLYIGQEGKKGNELEAINAIGSEKIRDINSNKYMKISVVETLPTTQEADVLYFVEL